MILNRLRRWGRLIKHDVLTLWFACRDPLTPWWIKLLAVALLLYGLSPIDLIPDVIPVFGLLDDAVIIPLGVTMLLRLLPRTVMARSAERAGVQRARGKRVVSGLGLVVVLWLVLLCYLIYRHVL